MIHFSALWRRSLLALGAAGAVATASAQTTTQLPFTAGNYVVVRIGDGSAALSSAATATFLLEYTPTGTLVQTLALPTTDLRPQLAFTETGTSTADAALSRSVDGRYLVLTGYNAPVGTAALSGTATTTYNRAVARISAAGVINTTTSILDAFSGTTVRGAASVDGSAFYVVGGNSGVVYVPLGNSNSSVAISTGSPVNDRVAVIYGGNLYVSSGSSPTYGISQVGTGLPTTGGQAQTLLPGFPTASASSASSYAFFFTDQSAAVAGPDVLYVADDGSATATAGIQKWSLVNNTWTLNGTIGTATGTTTAAVRGLTGTQVGGVVTMAATSNAGLYVLTDQAGYNAAPSTATLPAAVATPAANTAFRGLALAPLATALATRGQASQQELALYPNPAQDVLTVRLADGSAAGHQAEVRDLLGRLVLSATLPASGQLRLVGLAPGTYLLTVDGTLTRRISKVE